MSNLTALDVVGVVFNGNDSQITYLPNCTAAVSYADYTIAGARDFDLRRWDYYKGHLPYAIGGWVCAAICLVLAVCFTVWLLSMCACGCCGVRRRSNSEWRDSMAWHMHKDNPAAAPPARLRGFRGRHGTWNILFCALIVASLLIMLATSAWGLAAGIRATRHLSTDFWSVTENARTKVATLKTSVSAFFEGVAGLQAVLFAISTVLAGANLNQLVSELSLPLNLTGLANDQVSGAISDVANGLGQVSAGGNDVVDKIQRYGVKMLTDMRNDYKSTADDVQDIYVPIVLSVLFGVMVILGTTATVLLLLRRLRSGGTFLAFLWFWTVIYMICGPGALHVVDKYTSDSCLYPENFAFKVVNQTRSVSLADRGRITTGLEYYFGAFGTTVTLDEIISQVYGIDLALVSNLAGNPVVNETIVKLSSEAAQAVLSVTSALNSTQQQALAAAPTTLASIISSFNTLQRQMTRANYEGLYDQAKSLLCCTLADGTRDAWVAYTVASAFAALLCIMLSVRALQAARSSYTSRPPPAEAQFIVGPGANGVPPPNSGAGSPPGSNHRQTHPPYASNGYASNGYGGEQNGGGANGYAPQGGYPAPAAPGYAANGFDGYEASPAGGAAAQQRPSWPAAPPLQNGSYARFKEGA